MEEGVSLDNHVSVGWRKGCDVNKDVYSGDCDEGLLGEEGVRNEFLFEHVEKDGGTDFREEEVCEGDIFSIDKVAEEAEGLFLDLGFGVVAELHDVLWREFAEDGEFVSWGEAKDGVLEGPKSVETEGAIGGAGVEDDEGQEPALDHWGAEGGEFGDEVTDGGHDGSFDGEFSLEGLLAVGEARAVEPVVSVQDGVWVGGKKFVDAVEDVYGGEGGAEEGDAAGEGSEEVAGGDFYFAEVEGLKRDWELGFCEHEVEEGGEDTGGDDIFAEGV